MVKLISFYLPQFHPIPENDEWWGKGFTEWHNVIRAKPNFENHVQPTLPGELGYYDLRIDEVRHQQANLAKSYGIDGFCYYYYNFGGKRLLERPLDAHFSDKKLDMPFCLAWANENWTRRWDGAEKEILMRQPHTEQTDMAAFENIAQYMHDDRYIKIDDKPILLVYRATLLSNPVEIAQKWRERAVELGFKGLHLVAMETFGFDDAPKVGFDASVQFPPHNIATAEVTPPPNSDFEGKAFDYSGVMEAALGANFKGRTRYPGLMPAWDNTPRRKNKSHIYLGSSVEKFAQWLTSAIIKVQKENKPQNQLVFINAWNEWAEGAYLEPDMLNGRARLQAVKQARITAQSQESNSVEYLSAKVKALELENKALADLVGRTLALNGIDLPPSQFIKGEPETLKGKLRIQYKKAQFDTVNGRKISTANVIEKGEYLRLAGWCLNPPNSIVRQNSFVYIEFRQIGAYGSVYYTKISERIERDDVVAALRRVPLPLKEDCGFITCVSSENLPPGAYKVSIVQLSGGTIYTSNSNVQISVLG